MRQETGEEQCLRFAKVSWGLHMILRLSIPSSLTAGAFESANLRYGKVRPRFQILAADFSIGSALNRHAAGCGAAVYGVALSLVY